MLFEYQLGEVRVGVMILRFERGGRQVAQGCEPPRGVEPVDPDELAYSTSSEPRHGPSRLITSVLKRPTILSASA